MTFSTTSRAQNAPTLTIAGTGFDASSPSANAVVLSSGAAGAVTAATSTSLVVTLSTPPTSVGAAMTAVAASFGLSSGSPVQVATVVVPPVVTRNLANLVNNVPTLTIAGTGFDASSPSANGVAFNLGAVGTVTSATATTP